ncbi:unnamed protein product [Discosporangium mesarthrocarpum]
MLLHLCLELHKFLRPRMLHGTDIGTLCEMVSVVREEIVEEHRGRHGSSQVQKKGKEGEGQAAIETVLLKLVQDSQEKLIYCATKIIQEEIAGFIPTQDDLDYPAILQCTNPTLGAAGSGAGAGAGAVTGSNEAISSPSPNPNSSPNPYKGWYPPLRSTLLVLSRVYRAVDNGVFEDLAQTAVAACTHSLKARIAGIAGHGGASAKGGEKRVEGTGEDGGGVVEGAGGGEEGGGGRGEGEGGNGFGGTGEGGGSDIDAHLFLMKHFLTMREQLTPFDVEFVHADRKLNFSTTRTALRKFIRQTPGLFRFSRENAFVELTVESLPTVDEIRARAFEERGEAGLEQLRQQPFASVEKETVQVALEGATKSLPVVCMSMSQYLNNPATQAILLHPIQRKVVDAVETVRGTLQGMYSTEDLRVVSHLLSQVSQATLNAGEMGSGGRGVNRASSRGQLFAPTSQTGKH